MLYVLLALLGLLLALFLVCLVRTLLLKPTPAATATIDAPFDDRAREYAEGLGEMIRCETISDRNDPDRTKFYAFHTVMEGLFPKVHATCEKHVFNGSLLYKWPGSGKSEPILFMSHFDVVEATGEWQHDPFGGELIDGRVWGRGTLDTKGSLYCFMQAAEELIGEGFVPDCDIYLASTCTEEHGGEGAPLTAQWLQEQGVKLRMTLDEGGMVMQSPVKGVRGTYAVVGVLEKGYGDLKFTARGRGGHSSMPGPKTPLARLAAFIHECETKSPFKPKMSPTAKEMFRRFAPNMDFGFRFVMCNLWLFGPLVTRLMPKLVPMAGAMVKTTLAFTRAQGSDGYNVIPQTAWVTGNLRFIHHQDDVESIQIMKDIAAKHDIETEVLAVNKPCPEVDYNSDQFRLVEAAVGEVFPGVGVSPYVVVATTDSKFYREVCDNSLRFSPLYVHPDQSGGIHGLDENVDAAALPKAVDFYRIVMQKA